MLTDNKFNKYLIYGIGEIILVVIGILIALQINNWNENKKKEIEVINYLTNLKDALNEDIGSLEIGKLADLIIMDKDPLDDIQNTNTIIYTMINGRLYNTETMDEIGNEPKKRSKFYWENNKYNQAFPWHEESNSFMRNSCGCTSSHN